MESRLVSSMEVVDISGTSKRKHGGSEEEEEEEETLNLNQAAAAAKEVPSIKKRSYFPAKDRPFRLLPRVYSYDPTETRVSKLKKMIGILKKMETSLRSPERDASPPTLAELRLYNLILRHADIFIYLYHREAAADAKNLLSPLLPYSDAQDDVDVDIDNLKSQVRKASQDIDDTYDEDFSDGTLRVFLLNLVSLREKNSSTSKNDIEVEEKEEEDSPEQRIREQKLLDILFGLEVMRKEGGFGPPEDDEEILCYKKIRECVTSSLVYIEAKVAVSILHLYTDAFIYSIISLEGTRKKNKWFSISSLRSKCPFPVEQGPAKGWELIPQLHSIIKRCKERLFKILLNDGQMTMDEDDDEDVDGADDAPMTEIRQISETEEREREQFRLHCLQQIFHKFNLLHNLMAASNTMPTNEEVRLYVQIGNHISTSCWLFSTIPKNKNGSHKKETNFDIPNFQLFDSGRIASAGPTMKDKPIDVQTREECLREISSLLFPLKCASFGMVPTLKELAYYRKMTTLCRRFFPIFMAFSGSLDLEFNDVNERDKMSVLDISRLGTELLSLYKKELQLFREVKQKTCDLVDMVWPQFSKKYKEDYKSWEEKVEAYHKRLPQLDCFLKRSSLGRPERLDQVTVILEEANTIVSDAFDSLWPGNSIVTDFMCSRYHKHYQIVAEEINRTHHVIAFIQEHAAALTN